MANATGANIPTSMPIISSLAVRRCILASAPTAAQGKSVEDSIGYKLLLWQSPGVVEHGRFGGTTVHVGAGALTRPAE
jgi:hypothetical protein